MAIDALVYDPKYLIVSRRTRTGFGAGMFATPDDVDVSGGAVISPTLEIFSIIESQGYLPTRRTITDLSNGNAFDAGVNNRDSFTLTVTRQHTDLNNMISGVLLEDLSSGATPGTGFRGGGSAPDADVLNQLQIAIASQVAYTGDDVDYVDSEWQLDGFSNVKLREIRNAISRNDSPTFEIEVIPGTSKRAFDGRLFSSIAGFPGNEAVRYPYWTPHNVAVEDWVADGTDTSVILKYKPLYSDATINGRNLFFKNGVRIAVTTVNTTTGAVTFGAGAEDDRWRVMYMHAGDLI